MITMNELIELVTVLDREDDTDGFLIRENTCSVDVFAGIKSVGRTEYYEALRNGIEAKIIFVVDPDDFALSEREILVDERTKKIRASRVVYDGTTYMIKRTYRNNYGFLEMTCAEVE